MIAAGSGRSYSMAVWVLVAVALATVTMWPYLVAHNGCSVAADCDLAHTAVFWVWSLILVAAVAVAFLIRVHPTRTKVRILAALDFLWWLFVGAPIVYSDSHTIGVAALGLPSAVVVTVVWWLARRRARVPVSS